MAVLTVRHHEMVQLNRPTLDKYRINDNDTLTEQIYVIKYTYMILWDNNRPL